MLKSNMDALKLLMTTDTVGGVWTYSLELARALAPHHVEVALATMGQPPSPDQRAEAAALGNVELHTSTFKLEWMDQPWADVDAAGDWLLGLERDVEADLVHLNGYAHAALPWRAPVLAVGHSCVLSWWQAVHGQPAPPADWAVYRRRVGDGLRSANAVVAPSRAMLRELNRLYGPLPACRVIYNARRPDEFSPGRKDVVVFAAGRLWDEAKNIAALIEVADRLPCPVCVAGPEQFDSPRTLPRGRNVRYLGPQPPHVVASWLSRSAIYVLPALYEPFGLSALEAALSGCALVLGDIPSLREVWGSSALFVPPRDRDALHAAVRKLLDEPAVRKTYGARAIKRALRYSSERMAEKYLSLYAQLRCPTSTTAVRRPALAAQHAL